MSEETESSFDVNFILSKDKEIYGRAKNKGICLRSHAFKLDYWFYDSPEEAFHSNEYELKGTFGMKYNLCPLSRENRKNFIQAMKKSEKEIFKFGDGVAKNLLLKYSLHSDFDTFLKKSKDLSKKAGISTSDSMMLILFSGILSGDNYVEIKPSFIRKYMSEGSISDNFYKLSPSEAFYEISGKVRMVLSAVNSNKTKVRIAEKLLDKNLAGRYDSVKNNDKFLEDLIEVNKISKDRSVKDTEISLIVKNTLNEDFSKEIVKQSSIGLTSNVKISKIASIAKESSEYAVKFPKELVKYLLINSQEIEKGMEFSLSPRERRLFLKLKDSLKGEEKGAESLILAFYCLSFMKFSSLPGHQDFLSGLNLVEREGSLEKKTVELYSILESGLDPVIFKNLAKVINSSGEYDKSSRLEILSKLSGF